MRIAVSDPAGLALRTAVKLVSEVNQYRRSFDSDDQGRVIARRLPFGLYHVEVQQEGFAPFSELVEVRSVLPKELKIELTLAPVANRVEVTEESTIIDPHRTNSAERIGSDTIADRESAPPGRSMLDLVATEPGWILEANGILHPRGSQYQTQYVLDGVPLTDIRGPGFVSDFDVDNVQSMTVMTGNYPAEYGRKLGGVIEVNTARDTRPGFHGKVVASGGSFDAAGAYVETQYGWDKNTFTLSADGAHTERFLDPPVLGNYTNRATTTDLMAHYERDFSNTDRISLLFRRDQSLFLVPNEIVQQQAGQRQDRNSYETSGQISYLHVFSPNLLGDLRGMVRDVSAGLWSNDLSTPVEASQQRSYRESYLKGTLSAHYGVHEIKVGVEADFASIREALAYQITAPSMFDPGTNPAFRFLGRAQDREQAAFVQDTIRLKNWTLNAGLRFDHYGLLVEESAWSPRLGVAYYWPKAEMVFRASYDRVFQTPAFENLLVASSAEVLSLSDQVLRLPVRPSRGNFYQAGFTKGLFAKLRLDTSFFRRAVNNYADDDLLLNTGISFPIAFQKAEIDGMEVKLEVPRWGPVSGYLSYSNVTGRGYTPVTGGLFLGSDAANALIPTGAFPDSQDQRNSVSSRFRYQVRPRFWVALAASYGSGLPVEFDGTVQQALAQYGQLIVNQVNFNRGRLRPNFSLDASAGVTLLKSEKRTVRLQADVENLTDRLNLINFAGLFSGTALGTPRSVNCRLSVDF